MAKQKYTANSRITGLLGLPKVAEDVVPFGGTVELEEKAAAPLVACGALIAQKAPEKPAAPPAPSDQK